MIDAKYAAMKADPKYREFYNNPATIHEGPAQLDYFEQREQWAKNRLEAAQTSLSATEKSIAKVEAELNGLRQSPGGASAPDVASRVAALETKLSTLRGMEAEYKSQVASIPVEIKGHQNKHSASKQPPASPGGVVPADPKKPAATPDVKKPAATPDTPAGKPTRAKIAGAIRKAGGIGGLIALYFGYTNQASAAEASPGSSAGGDENGGSGAGYVAIGQALDDSGPIPDWVRNLAIGLDVASLPEQLNDLTGGKLGQRIPLPAAASKIAAKLPFVGLALDAIMGAYEDPNNPLHGAALAVLTGSATPQQLGMISGMLDAKFGHPSDNPLFWADIGTMVEGALKGASVGGPIGAIVGTAAAGGGLIYKAAVVEPRLADQEQRRVQDGQVAQSAALGEYRSGVEWKDRLVNMTDAEFAAHKESQQGVLDARLAHERSLLAEREKWWWDRDLTIDQIDRYLAQVRADIDRNRQELARIGEAERIRAERKNLPRPVAVTHGGSGAGYVQVGQMLGA